ncbi:hypothetical protein G1H11_15240 [Phytoactinopolyspora alkaliphila]|uniref:DUF3592 domain-containing protein n=1 Tax=Phytoactinopolyspora alkaliphila TaxID=1783498 RepID=A0A6N9YNT8_9ACTN|nr:hypothetical protein [Phytoactinopolyspora alkaliphila]NED96663.1 hypothetical protein [Phytoactinopolyspora alkaliphila]
MLKWMWWLGTPVLAALLLFLVVREVGPAYEAKFGSGTEGVFTVVEVVRGGRGHPVPHGDFAPDDGSPVLRDVALVTGGRLEPGDQVLAVDTGNKRGIYPADGGSDWLIITVVGAICVVGLIVWVMTVWRSIRLRGDARPGP